MNPEMTRRNFMTGLTATAAFFAAPGAFAGPGARLRFGILSDPHVVTKPDPGAVQNCSTFEPALRYFESRKADAVLCCGDLTDFGTPASLRRAGEIWDRVFPGGKRSDGAPVINLFHYGDHDMGGYAHKYGWAKDECEHYPEEVQVPICDVDYAKLYEECFHLPFAPVMVRDVKGYRFIVANHHPHTKETANGCRIPGLAEFLVQNAPTDRPFFYSQHRMLRGTLIDDELGCCDIGETAKALEKYPNAIAFCGHGHKNAVDESMFWQGAFSAIGVPSINYCCSRPGFENGYSGSDGKPEKWAMPRGNIWRTQQALFATVYSDRMVIERRDFRYNLPLGPDWVVPLPKADGRASWKARSKRMGAPQFPKGATVTVREDRGKNRAKQEIDRIGISFPVVSAVGKAPRAAYYEVTATAGKKELFRRKVFSPGIYWADEKDKGPVEFFCARADIPEELRATTVFSVVPMNAFGKGGRPIVCKLTA